MSRAATYTLFAILMGSCLALVGCATGERELSAADATTQPSGDDIQCPKCTIKHYEWTAYHWGNPVHRVADVMRCPSCRSAGANFWAAGKRVHACALCGKDVFRCPMCRNAED